MSMNPNMKSHHRDQLLQTVMHYLPMKVRKKIMLEVPAAYNDYCGRPVVTVCHTDDLTPVTDDPSQRVARMVMGSGEAA